MEINATNEACSTENENATHDTWFRLSLDLHTPRDKGGSNPDSNLSFSGTTPEAFDHALATILDVVTSTVYGGQLNGLQEIIDRRAAELRADSEKAQHGAATLEDILRQESPEDDAQQPKPKRNPALDVDTPKISTVTEPRPSFAPPLYAGRPGRKRLDATHLPGLPPHLQALRPGEHRQGQVLLRHRGAGGQRRPLRVHLQAVRQAFLRVDEHRGGDH